ncbi:MAG: glutamate synthase-related protein [Candidatus Thalassarchaeaceae archaeon]|nr:glutamate synthase-related protein [Candidatus Thalassarchaeaceae archaeon]
MLTTDLEEDSDNMTDGSVTIQLPVAEQARLNRVRADTYHRYHIDAIETENRQKFPRRFNVKVGKFGLAKLLGKEFFKYFGHWDVVFSRPCTYGVFSGPIGGFAPRPDLCVGCLRCEVQHPEFVKVTHNPELAALGDSYLTSKHISTIDEEARKGTVPVRGQGYRGRFGGPGFDQMFTDMSEIVRPSRDGIHGRELIGTSVDLGSKPMSLRFAPDGGLLDAPKMMTIQVPFFYAPPPDSIATGIVPEILAEAAGIVDTLAFLPESTVTNQGLANPNVVPIIAPGQIGNIESHGNGTRMVEMSSWNLDAWNQVKEHPLLVSVQLPFAGDWMSTMMEMIENGVSIIHLISDHHGEADDGRFVMELYQEAHFALVKNGCRDEVTLIGTGGIAGADHLPKSIITGMDAVGLDHPLLISMQARLLGDTKTRGVAGVQLPKKFDKEWAVQRILNLSCSWRDQLLEILGAMGVREVRRLRGETGRAMWCGHLEAEAFGDIEGFPGGEQ